MFNLIFLILLQKASQNLLLLPIYVILDLVYFKV